MRFCLIKVYGDLVSYVLQQTAKSQWPSRGVRMMNVGGWKSLDEINALAVFSMLNEDPNLVLQATIA